MNDQVKCEMRFSSVQLVVVVVVVTWFVLFGCLAAGLVLPSLRGVANLHFCFSLALLGFVYFRLLPQ
jgi:hypothetical protein